MPRVSEEKLARMKAAAHRGLAHASHGIKSTILPLGAGAASAVAIDKVFDSMPAFIRENWWGRGATIAVAGHFIGVKKNRRAGDALLGAAGAKLYEDYKSKGSSPSAKGLDDAGALVDRMVSSVERLNAAVAPVAQMIQAGAIMGAGSGLGGDAGAYVPDGGAGDADDVGDVYGDAGDWGDSF